VRVAACYLAESSQVIIVTRSRRFDFELADLISDLETELADAGAFVDMIQLPAGSPEMLRSFFDPTSSRLIAGT
jgi:hypothetical protein